MDHLCRLKRYTGTWCSHLAEAALPQNHQEVEVRQPHAILVAIGVKPGRCICRLALCVLANCNFSPLDGREW